MAYEKQNFEPGQILTAAQMNHIEDGVAQAEKSAEWENVQDRPFYEERAVGVVVPETTVVIDPENMTGGIGARPGKMFAGETYSVKWNGAEYSCVCSEMEDGDITVSVLGNMGALEGEEGTGEPFVLLVLPPDTSEEIRENFIGGGYVAVLALDGSVSVTVSVEGMTQVTHRMDGKFAPAFRDAYETIVIDLDREKATTGIDVALGMDEAELQTRLIVVYEGERHSVSGVRMQTTEYPALNITSRALRITFQHVTGTASALNSEGTAVTVHFDWDEYWGIRGIEKTSGMEPFTYGGMYRYAFVYGVSAQKYGGNDKPGWVSMDDFLVPGLLLKSTTEGSEKKFLLTVDDSGNLSVTEKP